MPVRTMRMGRHAAALLAYFLLTALMTWPAIREVAAAIPGDGFDGWQNYWNLWWIKVALIDRHVNPLATDLLFHPTGVTLYFQTLNPFNGLVGLPVQLSAGLIPAYNFAVFLAFTLGGYGAFLLTTWVIKSGDQRSKIEDQRLKIRDRGGPPPNPPISQSPNLQFFAPLIAGMIFTLSPFHMAHLLGHMQVLSLQWLPFYMLYLLRALKAARGRKPWLREAAMTALFLILTGLCDWYFVLYLVFFTGIAVLWTWLTPPQGKVEQQVGEKNSAGMQKGGHIFAGLPELLRLVLPAALAGALFFVALSFWLIPMLRETRAFSFMVRPAQELYILSASVMDFLIPNRLHTLFRPDSFTWIGNQIAPVSERTIGIGYTALLLALLGAWRGRRMGLWIAAALFFFAMALGPVIHWGNITAADIPATEELSLHFTPFGILAYFSSFVRLSRSVSRYAVMVQLAVAVLAGAGLAQLMWSANGRRGRQTAAIALAGLLILAEYWVAPYPMSPPDTPDWYATLAHEPGDGALLNLPMNYDRPGYLLYQTVHQRPLAVAYISRDDPRTLTERTPVLQHFRHLGPDILSVDPVAAGMTVLHDLGIEYVTLDRYKMPGGLERTYTEELAAALFAGQEPIHTDDRLTVYRVTAPETVQPYPVLGPLNWSPLDETASSRALLGPAELLIYHAPPGSRVSIRYRTAGQATARLTTGAEAYDLAPAPGGNSVTIPLDTSADPVIITITPSALGDVHVQAVEVMPP
ncbi:MAG: hypothetical protein KDD92_11450 [Caldilineaceae bacterium]|nr:hypothetical protein [Caldilineaceae bacterium]